MKENHTFQKSSEVIYSADCSTCWVRCESCKALIPISCANYECPRGKEIKNETKGTDNSYINPSNN